MKVAALKSSFTSDGSTPAENAGCELFFWDPLTQNIVGMQSAHVPDRHSITPLRLAGAVALRIAAVYISE